jgi:hypothetical protein
MLPPLSRRKSDLTLARPATRLAGKTVRRTVRQTWVYSLKFSDNSVTSRLCSRRHPRQPHFLPCHLARRPSHGHHMNSAFQVALELQNTGPTMAKGITNSLPPPVQVLPPLCGRCSRARGLLGITELSKASIMSGI